MVTLEIKDCCVTTKADVLNTLKEIEYRIEQGYNSGITTEDVNWSISGEEEYAEEDDNKVYELCHYCEREVELLAEFKVQECPNCGKYIAPCRMCDLNTCECDKCDLLDECDKLNRRKEMVYIGRNEYCYMTQDIEEDMSSPRTWDYSDNISDRVFIEEVYRIDEDYIGELEWWLECQYMNEFKRQQCACTYDNRTSEEMFQYLKKHSKMVIDYDGNYINS